MQRGYGTQEELQGIKNPRIWTSISRGCDGILPFHLIIDPCGFQLYDKNYSGRIIFFRYAIWYAADSVISPYRRRDEASGSEDSESDTELSSRIMG